jgi:hypothetical protein
MTEYLDLSEEQGAQFFPRFNEHKKRVEQIRKDQEQLATDFMEQVEAGKVGKKATEQYLAKSALLKRAQMDEHEKLIREASDILSDEQYARFAAFDDHFKRQIKMRMGNRGMGRDMMQGRMQGKRGKMKRR